MFNWFKKKEDKGSAVFTREQLKTIFKNAFGDKCVVYADDESYVAISTSEFMKLARKRNVEPNYVKNLYDCNRFAHGFYTDISRLWATDTWANYNLAFGVVKVKQPNGKPNHALIVQVDHKGIIHFIEPQFDMEVDGKDFTPYFVEA